MKFRFTIKELEEWSDLRILTTLLNERLSDLNPYAPLATRLKQILAKIASKKPLTDHDATQSAS